MKKELHPDKYRLVVFKDMSNGYSFITKSTATSKETIKMDDGKEYPLVKLEISNTSHPFYTGKMKLVDTAGRVDKFNTRYKKHIDMKTTQEGYIPFCTDHLTRLSPGRQPFLFSRILLNTGVFFYFYMHENHPFRSARNLGKPASPHFHPPGQ
jgi:large subunit ribosomal protein L31